MLFSYIHPHSLEGPITHKIHSCTHTQTDTHTRVPVCVRVRMHVHECILCITDAMETMGIMFFFCSAVLFKYEFIQVFFFNVNVYWIFFVIF